MSGVPPETTFAGPNGSRATVAEGPPRGTDDATAWQQIDWRSHQRWIEVAGSPVNTIELGSGPPLLFIHGLSGSWPNWLAQLAAFAAEKRVIAVDLPGFGHSPMPAEPITMAGYGRLIDGLMGELGVSAAAVVGNSMGGLIAAELAISFPHRVEQLVLVSAAGYSTFGDPRTTRALPALQRAERIAAATGAWAATRSRGLTRHRRSRSLILGLVVAHPSRLPGALAAEQVRGAGKPGFLPALASLVSYDISARFPEIACPTLIVWGEKDRLIGVADADRFAELIPDSRKVIFKDTGHMAMLERPEEFNPLLRSFLDDDRPG